MDNNPVTNISNPTPAEETIPETGTENKAEFPPAAGTAPSVRICPRCGQALPAEAAFCGKCGLNLNAYDRNLTAAQAAPQFAQPYAPARDTSPLKTGDFFLLIFLSGLPIAGLILMIVWAFSDNLNINRKNFCRALLLWYAIGIAIAVVFYIALFAIFAFFASLGYGDSSFYPTTLSLLQSL